MQQVFEDIKSGLNSTRVLLVILVILELLALNLSYDLIMSGRNGLQQANSLYPPGTQITSGFEYPQGFPYKTLVAEEYPLYGASKVSVPNLNDQYMVSYVSQRPLIDILNLYTHTLTDAKWSISQTNVNKNGGMLIAKKDNANLIMSLVPWSRNGSLVGNMVTFQYEVSTKK